jgi:hypothetical protein
MRQEVSVLTLVKGAERFVYIYDQDSGDVLVNVLRDHAADPQLRINWFDVALLMEKVQAQQTSSAKPPTTELPKAS